MPKAAKTPAPEVTTEPKGYEHSTSSKFLRLLARADKEERAFLDRLVSEWIGDRHSTLQETTFDVATRELGFRFTHACDMDDRGQWVSDMTTAWEILYLRRNEAIGRVLRTILRLHPNGLMTTFGDVLQVVEEEIRQEEMELEDARAMIELRPEALRNEIRAAIQKHPELMEGM